MTSQQPTDELEIRGKSQELAVAWRKGRASFVLDSLAAEDPLRAGLIATLVHESLARWDPYDSRWPNGFLHALLMRSRGAITSAELAELEREYSRIFGSSPPPPALEGAPERARTEPVRRLHAERIRSALASGEPLVRERAGGSSPMFLRLQPARHGAGELTARQ